MQAIERRKLGFVRTLLKSGSAKMSTDGLFKAVCADRVASLTEVECKKLASDGVLNLDNGEITCRPETSGWVRRQLSAGEGAFADQHRSTKTDREGRQLNTNESPLARLAATNKMNAFLEAHHIQAGERFHRLVERAGLRQRVTMSYDANRTTNAAAPGQGGFDISDMAVDARKELDRICAKLPQDCAGVVFDVCGFEKGLQLVETERGWPRRSAKLVLRIGLEQLAQHFGLALAATGTERQKLSGWIDADARPTRFG